MLQLLRNLLTNRFWAQGNRVWYGAFYASTAMHVTVIILLAFKLVPDHQQTETTSVISSQWEETKDKTILKEPLETITLIPKDVSSAAGGQPKSIASLFKADQTFHSPHLKIEPVSLLVEDSTQTIPQAFLSEVIGEVAKTGEAQQKGNGQGNGAGDGKGDGKGAPFFGMNAKGKKFVYVVDCSGSMNHPHPSDAKTRFRRLKLELHKSISQMDMNQEFYVIFFSSMAYPMPSKKMQPATNYNKNVLFPWIAKFKAVGDTDPRTSLQLAIKLKPDVIYFLTDGSFIHKVEKSLEKFSQSKTTIHTYAFGNKNGEPMLKQIAKNNNGKYTFVP